MFRLSARNVAGMGVGVAVLAVPLLSVFPGQAGFVIFVAVALVGGTVVVVSEVRRARRRDELVQFARRIGWTYAERSLLVAEGLRSFPFGTGVDRADVDVLTGEFQGMRCAHFVHRFTERRGGSTPGQVEAAVPQEFQITAVALGADYPTIDILPEDVVARAAKLVGGMDVDFESAEFNRAWRVRGGDRRYVHDMITPRVMDVLVRQDARGMALRIEGRNLITWRAGRAPTDELAHTLALLTAIARVLPPHVERALLEEQRAREANAPEWAKTPGALTSGRYTLLGAELWEAEVAAHGESAEKPAMKPAVDPAVGPAVGPAVTPADNSDADGPR